MITITGKKTAEQIVRASFAREAAAEREAAEEASRQAAEDQQRKAAGSGSGGTGAGAGNPPPNPACVINAGDYLKLENLLCVDADGNEFEKYGELYVRKYIFRDDQRQQLNFTPYNAAVYCEQNGLFLPSFALSCNILQALFQQRSNPEIKAVLDQYKDQGNGAGYHAQNSIVDFAQQQVIHYPTAADFEVGNIINTARQRRTGNFDKSALQDELLDVALGNPAVTRYVQQSTGLRNPCILVEIGDYFGRPAKLWFPWIGPNGAGFTGKRAVWLGCNLVNFYLYAYNVLNSSYAVRGVRLGAPPGAP